MRIFIVAIAIVVLGCGTTDPIAPKEKKLVTGVNKAHLVMQGVGRALTHKRFKILVSNRR